MDAKKEIDEATQKLVGQGLSFEEMQKDLNNTSPLQMSKKLIEYELFEQQSSIEIINKIYDEFENKDNLINSLVNPMLFGIVDGLIKHPKLNGTFRKTGITPSKLVKEVNGFTYDVYIAKNVDGDVFFTQAEKTHYSNGLRSKHYDNKKRTETEEDKNIVRDETITYTDKNGKSKTKKTATVTDDVTGEKLDLTEEGAKQKNVKTANMDHVNPINSIRKKYKNNPYLYRDDLSKIVGLEENESYINASLNKSKGDMTWKQYIEKYPNALSKEEQKKALELEEKANKAQKKEATKLMAKNIGLKGLGDIIILLLKPIWFEIKDMFKNGILSGFNTDDKIKAFLLRLKRVGQFIKKNVLSTLSDSLKEIVGNFVSMLVSAIIDIFKGIFKKIVQIISDGFMAIKEAFKIMMKPENEMSSAQTADAITKIIASAVVPILIFSFEETLSKIPIIGDVATIILSGLATTLVVWLLDELDLFSVKDEKRLARVKEIFALRIENIKSNTDIFEKTSIEVLAKQRLQFVKIMNNMNSMINDNPNINASVYEMADFMQIDLKVKTTDDFMSMLIAQKSLQI